MKYIAFTLLILLPFSSSNILGAEIMTNEKEVTFYIPALVALLVRAQELKGSPLSKEEVLNITADAPSVKMPESVAKATAKDRGYDDIDPNNVWHEWQKIHAQFQK